MRLADRHTQGLLIPLGLRSRRWLTPLTVADCRRALEDRSGGYIGMQVYGAAASTHNAGLNLRVRFRPWWELHQQAELAVEIEPDASRDSLTTVRVVAGLRVGAAVLVLVWMAVLLVPFLAFSQLPTRVFFGVVGALPLILAPVTARIQIRAAMRQLRTALPEAPVDGP